MKKILTFLIPVILGLFFLLFFFWESEPKKPPHVFLITLDGVSAENTFLRGYERDTMPFLKKISKEGVVFTNAVSLASQSLPGHATILTSLSPKSLDIYKNGQSFEDGIATLALLLRSHNFAPVAYLNTGLFYLANAPLLRGYNANRDINFYDEDSTQTPTLFPEFFKSLRNNVERIKSGELKQPLHYWLHCQYAHSPYFHLERHQSLFPVDGEEAFQGSDERSVHSKIHLGQMPSALEMAALKARYDRSLRHMDENLEAFFALLDELGIRDQSLVVITADHGESFEPASGGGHSGIIDENVQRIPLLFFFPDKRFGGVRVDELVDQRDILPTIAHFLGIRVPAQAEGRSLLPMMAGARVWKPHSVVSVASPFVASSIRNKRWKLIPPTTEKKSYVTAYNKLSLEYFLYPYAKNALLFDLQSDPEAKTNVASEHPGIVQSLTTKLEKLSGSGGFVKTRLSRDVLQVLAEEGYLDPEEAGK